MPFEHKSLKVRLRPKGTEVILSLNSLPGSIELPGFFVFRAIQPIAAGGTWLAVSTASSAMKAIRRASDRLRTRSFSIMLAR